MRILLGRASARYKGRIEAELSPGDIVLLLRDPAQGGDGSALLFDRAVGVQPRNWMPAGSQITEEEWSKKKIKGRMLLEHLSRGESLEIFWHRLEEELFLPSSLATELSRFGAEEEFSDLLAENLDMILPGLDLIQREYRTGVGPIDILAFDGERPVVIEVKRRQITISAAYQARRYVEALHSEKHFEQRAKAILVAPSLARGAKEWIENKRNIAFVRIGYEDLRS